MSASVQLYKIPEKFEVARVLDDSVLQAYNDSIQGFNPRAKEVLGRFESANGQITGSNPFMLVHLLNQRLIPGERLVERPDLEIAITNDPEFVKRNWIDFGIALKTPGDSYNPNDLPARILAKQLEQREIPLGSGKLVPFNLLTNKEDGNSAYGFVFALNEQFERGSVIRDLSDFKWNYTRNEGMARAFLDSYRDWVYDDRDLEVSNGNARVVVVGGEATSKNFDEFSAKLEAQRNEFEIKLDRTRRAQAILKGE